MATGDEKRAVRNRHYLISVLFPAQYCLKGREAKRRHTYAFEAETGPLATACVVGRARGCCVGTVCIEAVDAADLNNTGKSGIKASSCERIRNARIRGRLAIVLDYYANHYS